MARQFIRCARTVFLLAIVFAWTSRSVDAGEADDQYAVAAGHYAAQRWQLAIDEFRTLIKDHPDDANSTKSHFFLGEALVQLGKHEEAAAEFKLFLARDPNGPLARQALFRAGELAFLAGQREAAHRALGEFHNKYPDDALNEYALTYLGEIALADKDAAAAQTELNEALRRFPDTGRRDQIHFDLARAAELQDDRRAAEKIYREVAAGRDAALAKQAGLRLEALQVASAESLMAAKKFAEAADALEGYLKAQPAGELADRALAQLAVCRLQLGDNDKAASTFDRLLDQFPDSPAAAEAAWNRGQVLERLKKFDAALSSYQFIIDKHKTSQRFDDALLAAARLHNELQQSSQAIELYQRFVRERNGSPQLDAARYGLAWALRDAGNRAESDAQFQALHDDFRQSRFWNDATFRLAESALAQKHADRATQLLDELLAAKPSAEMLQHALYLQGQVAVAEQKWDRAAAVMTTLAHDYPDSALRFPADYWIAEAAYRQAQYDEAGKRFATLADQVGGRKEKWLAMIPLRRAQILAQQKQWTDAQAIAAHIEAAYPDFSEQFEADYLIGRALAAQADFDGARRQYLKVIRSPTGGKSETAAMAQWMIGESYFHQENYEAALREYLRVEILYSYPRWQAAALLQAGKCQEALGHGKDAADLYRRLIKAYSNTEFTDEAQRRLHDAETHATAAR